MSDARQRQVPCFRVGGRLVAVLARCHGRLPYAELQSEVALGEQRFSVVDVGQSLRLRPAPEAPLDLVLVEEEGARAALKVEGPARLARIDSSRILAVPPVYDSVERRPWVGFFPAADAQLLPILDLPGLLEIG